MRNDETIKPAIFGTEPNDINLSKRFNAYEEARQLRSNSDQLAEITLAIAQFDISSLLRPTWIYVEKNACHNPNHVIFPKTSPWDSLDFTDLLTVQEVNLKNCPRPLNTSPLSEALLLDHGTCLKVESFLQAPQLAFLHVQTLPGTFQRMLIIVKNTEVAMTLLNEILFNNQMEHMPEVVSVNYLKTAPSLNPFKLPRSESSLRVSINVDMCESTYGKVLSGFMIDNIDCYTFFIEGTAKSFFPAIWRQFMDLHENTVSLFSLN